MQKPAKTFADYLVVAISPMLIMVLVGSLAFFLIQVFYRGEMIHGIRWVMFWFVLAIVLVSRIGLEQSNGHAVFYGVALAVVMWIYLAYEHAMPVLGVVLLGVTWWCAHRLTVDCTLINDEQDASGEGMLQGLLHKVEQSVIPPSTLPLPQKKLSPLELMVAADLEKRRRRAKAPTPGRWVIYFSLAALPLFGLGQLLLPSDDPAARRAGFVFLAFYLAAALSLLMTTSFLGLRRYLRQRSVEMSTSIALGWVRFGVILAVGILLLALVLPRPGALNTWKNLTYQIEHKKHKASDYALPFNAPGEGDGQPATQQKNTDQPASHSADNASGSGAQATHDTTQSHSPADNQPSKPNQSSGSGQSDGKSGSGDGKQSGEGSGSGKIARDNSPSGDSGSSGNNGESDGNNGSGNGKAAVQKPADGDRAASERNQSDKDSQPKEPKEQKQKPAPSEPQPAEPPSGNSGKPESHQTDFSKLLRVLVMIAVASLCIWFVVRYRQAIAQALRAFTAAVREFFHKLFSFRRPKPKSTANFPSSILPLEPFAEYENPFVTGKDKIWPPERLVLYTYEAVLAWAKERSIELRPQETPREFCARLCEGFPDFGPELESLSYFYSHAAFAKQLPDDFEPEPLRRLWEYLGDSVAVLASR